MAKAKPKWYAEWFDTPFYHILYQDRDYKEAEAFMRNLIGYLKLKQGDNILDLACGKGRHSIFLNQMGFDVLGTDLSENSISQAKKHEHKNLRFKVNDMCQPLDQNFDAVFNLFKSFGYFKKEENNLKAVKAISENLEPGGFAVIDFMNTHQVKKNLIPENEKQVNGINFHLKRWTDGEFIFKKIKFSFDGENHSYVERVKCLELDDFERYFKKSGLEKVAVFGNYALDDFDQDESERLILIAQK